MVDIISKNKDVILVLVAVLSLLLNGFLIYWQNLRNVSDAKAALLMTSGQDKIISTDIVFSNSGNQYMVIESVALLVCGKKKVKEKYGPVYSVIKGFGGILSSDEDALFPKILKPGEMYLAKLRAPYDLLNYIEKAINSNSEYYPNLAIVKLAIHTMNNKGERFRVICTRSIMTHGDTGGADLSEEHDSMDRPRLIDLLTDSIKALPDEDQAQPFLVP